LNLARRTPRCYSVRVISRLSPVIFILGIGSAKAGMTSIVLTDLAEARIEVISFFIAIYLFLTLVVKFLWNRLAKGFPSLPAINFRKALCLMLVSGLFMYVILTMISGARELMTPGAWEKEGISYRLASSGNPRKDQITKLRDALWEYSDAHDGRFPKGRIDPAIPRENWLLPDENGFYSFVPPEAPGRILVFEPPIAGKKSYVVLEDGSVELWSRAKIQKEITQEP